MYAEEKGKSIWIRSSCMPDLTNYHTRMQVGYVFGRVCLSVRVSVWSGYITYEPHHVYEPLAFKSNAFWFCKRERKFNKIIESQRLKNKKYVTYKHE